MDSTDPDPPHCWYHLQFFIRGPKNKFQTYKPVVLLHSVAEPEPVLFGRSRSRWEDVKAKTFFLLLLSLFLYEKEPEPVKKSTWSRSRSKQDRLRNTALARRQSWPSAYGLHRRACLFWNADHSDTPAPQQELDSRADIHKGNVPTGSRPSDTGHDNDHIGLRFGLQRMLRPIF